MGFLQRFWSSFSALSGVRLISAPQSVSDAVPSATQAASSPLIYLGECRAYLSIPLGVRLMELNRISRPSKRRSRSSALPSPLDASQHLRRNIPRLGHGTLVVRDSNHISGRDWAHYVRFARRPLDEEDTITGLRRIKPPRVQDRRPIVCSSQPGISVDLAQ